MTKSYKIFTEAVKDSEKIEAHGVKGMKSTPWRKVFKNIEALNKWLEDNDAECHATRELERTVEGLSEGSAGRVKWAFMPPTIKVLTIGEERMLTDTEVTEVNKLLDGIWSDSTRLNDIFRRARSRNPDSKYASKL